MKCERCGEEMSLTVLTTASMIRKLYDCKQCETGHLIIGVNNEKSCMSDLQTKKGDSDQVQNI